jgi:hypothetical protein
MEQKRAETHKLITYMNRNARILNKILENKIKMYKKRNTNHSQVIFITKIKTWLKIWKYN